MVVWSRGWQECWIEADGRCVGEKIDGEQLPMPPASGLCSLTDGGATPRVRKGAVGQSGTGTVSASGKQGWLRPPVEPSWGPAILPVAGSCSRRPGIAVPCP